MRSPLSSSGYVSNAKLSPTFPQKERARKEESCEVIELDASDDDYDQKDNEGKQMALNTGLHEETEKPSLPFPDDHRSIGTLFAEAEKIKRRSRAITTGERQQLARLYQTVLAPAEHVEILSAELQNI